jgi:glutamate-1-semialdehyde 2,1-aminomutase
MYNRARSFFAGGQSHNARFFEPYPFFAARGSGKHLWDIDGNRYVDYWMGHTALILGHSPPIVTKEIREEADKGLLLGTPNKFAFELGELVSKSVPCAEMIRFCTTGAEATMYASRLARAFTKRKIIVKMAGGWHGYSSPLAVGVSAPYDVSESAGLVGEEEACVKIAPFNNLEETRRVLADNASDVAGVILEPVLGAGGVIPAERDYLASLKEECNRLGGLLIFDEIITGFRLALGGAQEFYGVKPDLCTLGKILGGGLPASAVAGRDDVMSLADTTTGKSKTERCWIGGGTFSEHTLSMKAGIVTLRYLKSNKGSLYPHLARMGSDIRKRVDKEFSDNGIKTQSTGEGSLFVTHFLNEGQEKIRRPEDVNSSNKKLQHEYYFSMIADHSIFFLPGHIGAVSTAHLKSDIDSFAKATGSVAQTLARQQHN